MMNRYEIASKARRAERYGKKPDHFEWLHLLELKCELSQLVWVVWNFTILNRCPTINFINLFLHSHGALKEVFDNISLYFFFSISFLSPLEFYSFSFLTFFLLQANVAVSYPLIGIFCFRCFDYRAIKIHKNELKSAECAMKKTATDVFAEAQSHFKIHHNVVFCTRSERIHF